MVVNFSQRMPDDLHKRVRAFATENGLSINGAINQACEYFLASGNYANTERRLAALEQWRETVGAVSPVPTPAKSGGSNLADLDVDSLGKTDAVVPPKLEAVQEEKKPQKLDSLPFLTWILDKDAVPVLLEPEEGMGQYYDPRADRHCYTKAEYHKNSPAEKEGYDFLPPVFVKVPKFEKGDPLPIWLRGKQVWVFHWQGWKTCSDKELKILNSLPRDYKAWWKQVDQWEREEWRRQRGLKQNNTSEDNYYEWGYDYDKDEWEWNESEKSD